MKVDLFKLFDIIKANPEDFAVFHRDLEDKDYGWDDDDAELVMRKHDLSTEEMTYIIEAFDIAKADIRLAATRAADAAEKIGGDWLSTYKATISDERSRILDRVNKRFATIICRIIHVND